MSKTSQELLSTALSLPEADRLSIAVELLASVGDHVHEQTDEEWLVELVRRRDEYLEDPSTGVSWDELKAEGHG